MWDIRRAVEKCIDTMPTVRCDDRALLLFSVFLYCVADVAEGKSWFDGFNGKAETFASGLDQVDI